MKKLIPVLCCLALLAVTCSTVKAPAQLAIKAAEEALGAVREEAQKFVPDQFAGLESSLTAAKASFEKGEYAAALAAAKDIPAKIGELKTAIETKKNELPQTWAALAADLPKLIAGVKTAIDKAKGVDKAVLETAKTDYAGLPGAWNKAQEAFKAGDIMGAVNQAMQIKDQAAKILTSISAKPI